MSTGDGIRLAIQRWSANADTRRGTILIVHGLGEHVGRYRHVVDRLTGLGFDVAGADLRGHGGSGGKRGSVPHADSLLDDLALVVDEVGGGAAPPRNAPFLLLGHSLGGLLTAQFVARAVRPVDGLVLSSPAFAADLTVRQRLQLALGRILTPDLAVANQLKVDRISHDPAVVRAYRDDPLVHDRISARLAVATLEGGVEVLRAAPGWRVPTLLLWSGDDHLVSSVGSDTFAASAPRTVVTAERFDDLWHEILNEPGRERVFASLERWLATRFPPILLR